jgi:hypothetical protein
MVDRSGAYPGMQKLTVVALMVVASTLGACEFAESGLAPSITGKVPASTPRPAAVAPLDQAELGAPSGTSVGARVPRFRSDLAQLQQAAVRQIQHGRQLQGEMNASIAAYDTAVESIEPVQPGGTASSESISAWQRAQAQLRAISAALDQMNGLSAEVTKNVAFSAYLLQSIRAAGTAPDAVDEDRRQLQLLEDATAQTSASLDQLLDTMQQDVRRQSHFLGTEGAKLAQMAPPGAAAANVATAPQQPQLPAPSAQPAGPAGSGLASGRPFVVIRFDDPSVDYERQLQDAVSAALARSPNLGFDLVAAAPAGGTSEDIARNSEAARASMERVRGSLLDMGLSPDRVSISQVTDPNIESNEVRLYVR